MDKFIWDKSLFEETVELPFEDTTISCPAGYHKLLTQRYGDYNVFVKGTAVHTFIVLDPDTPYKEKFKERYGCTPKEYKTSLLQKDNRLALDDGAEQSADEPHLSRFHWSAQSEAREELYELIAADASMVRAGIYPGDKILVKKQSTAENGDLVLAKNPDGSLLPRQLYVLDAEGKYILHACADEHRSHPDVYLDAPQIVGVIVGVLHDPKNSRFFV